MVALRAKDIVCLLFAKLAALPLVAQDPCEMVVIPTETVVSADDMSFDGKCIVIERGSRVTIDGAHSFHSVTIEAGATVTHTAGALGRLRWTVATEVSVLGSLDVTGKGLAGANDGGGGDSSQSAGPASNCDMVDVVAGAGALAGGSHGGRGGMCGSAQCLEGASTLPYGSVEEPCLPGGGGGNCGDGQGGNGGGVIRIEAATIRVNGTIIADGAPAPNRAAGAGGGAGGSIYLRADDILGNGRLQANGGAGAFSFGGGGGAGGRIALAAGAQMAIPEANFDAHGGMGVQDCPFGEVGTVWLRLGDLPPTLLLGSCSTTSAPRLPVSAPVSGRVVVRGPIIVTPADWQALQPTRLEVLCQAVFLVDESFSFPTADALFVDGGAVRVAPDAVLGLPVLDASVLERGNLDVAGAVEVASGEMSLARNVTYEQGGRGVKLFGAAGAVLEKLTVEAGAIVTHRAGSEHAVILRASHEIGIDGSINVNGKGIAAADGVDVVDTLTVDPASTCEAIQLIPGAGPLSGGSHGGLGASCGTNQCVESARAPAYGTITEPCLPGSPGGACGGGIGGSGGGVVELEATTIRINGSVIADGAPATNRAEGAGGGSGGSVMISAENLLGRGSVQANGGAGAFSFGGGGGGGGRLAVNVSSQLALPETSFNASGGQGAQACSPGQVGTIWIAFGETRTLLLGACQGVGAPTPPAFDGIEPPDRVIVRGPVRLNSDAMLAVDAGRVEFLCAGTLLVDRALDLPDEGALLVDGGTVDVLGGATLNMAEWTLETIRVGNVRLAGMVQVASGVVEVNRNVTVEQVGRGIRLMGPGGGPLQSLTVASGGTMTHAPGFGHEVQITASEDVTIEGFIDVSGRGLPGGSEEALSEAIDPESGVGSPRTTTGAGALAGGSYGGEGGMCGNDQCVAGASNAVYGTPELPVYPGSGGGSCGAGLAGSGGGVVRIDAPVVRVNGLVNADGTVAQNRAAGAGGGSGGSILLLVENLLGRGRMTANGGAGAFSFGGGGGSGGRIAIRYAAGIALAQDNLEAKGGAGAQECPEGAPGTVSTENIERTTVFLRGDCDGDASPATITDAVVLLNFNFIGMNEPPCLAACDSDGDGAVRGLITDAVYSLNFAFLGGPPPVAPFPECGSGTDKDLMLGCKSKPAGCL